MRTRRSRQEGLTLVEIVVSVPIITIALLGTVGALSVAAGMSRSTEETRQATRANTIIMEQIRSTPFAELVEEMNGTEYPLHDLVPEADGGTLRITVEDADPDDAGGEWEVFRVVVSAEWAGSSGTRNVEFATFVSNRAAASTSLQGGANLLTSDGGDGGATASAGDTASAASSMLDGGTTDPGTTDPGTTDPGTTTNGNGNGKGKNK